MVVSSDDKARQELVAMRQRIAKRRKAKQKRITRQRIALNKAFKYKAIDEDNDD